MQRHLFNEFVILKCICQPFLRKYQPCLYPAIQFCTNFVSPSTCERHIFRKHSPTLYSIRAFKTMECCGNSCGIVLSKEALKKKLTSMQYQVTQEGDTERAFTGKYYNHFEKGTYLCIVCNQDLFSSEAKFDSKCGWPAFYDVVDTNNVKFKNDLSHDMNRTEVSCSKCGAHLGHVFDDGPKPTGKRYCINSAALDFKKLEENNLPDSSTDAVSKS